MALWQYEMTYLDFEKSSEIESWTVLKTGTLYRKFCQEMKKFWFITNHNSVDNTSKKFNAVNVQGWCDIKRIEFDRE